MKKLSWVLVLAMLLSMFAMSATAEGEYSQAPMLDARVESGELPPVEERLPENPRVNTTDYAEDQLEMEVGTYGGTLRLANNAVNFNAEILVGMTENLLNMQGINSGVIEPNLVESYEVSEDLTTYTFTLRKGLKWSDGTEVTMEDIEFTVNNVIFNTEITPVIASWMTAGGEPFEFTVVDEMTFQFKFAAPYGGLPLYLTASGFTGYTALLKPAHYLKPFHKDFAEECHGSLEAYYEFIAPFGKVMGYDDVTAESVWVFIFNQLDMTEWECTDPNSAIASVYFEGLIDKNMPQLFPWIMVSSVNGVDTWERNPYYHKVDADGQQLPYIDYLTSTLVQDAEMMSMAVISGEVDFQSATNNITLYRENAEAAGIAPQLLFQGNTPADLYLNVNYGLNADGTVKDDDASKAWQEVIVIDEFRKAIATAIDADEILEAVYSGLGNVNEQSGCIGDTGAANDLLDEIGMIDIDGDGFRETPSGLKFSFQIWNDSFSPEIIPTTELFVEYLTAIGLDVQGYTTDSTLLTTAQSANEVPARCCLSDFAVIWYFNNTYGVSIWAPLWNQWFAQGMPADNAELLAPTDPEMIELFDTLASMLEYDIEETANVIRPEIMQTLEGNGYVIRPMANVMGVMVFNKDIRNVASECVSHAVNYFIEDMYFAQ